MTLARVVVVKNTKSAACIDCRQQPARLKCISSKNWIQRVIFTMTKLAHAITFLMKKAKIIIKISGLTE